MRKFDIPCPRVQLLRKHILVMTFIGKDQIPAPKIKDAKLPPEDLQIAYNQIISVSDKPLKTHHKFAVSISKLGTYFSTHNVPISIIVQGSNLAKFSTCIFSQVEFLATC